VKKKKKKKKKKKNPISRGEECGLGALYLANLELPQQMSIQATTVTQ
jgi:hypothetical protein